ncbi:MAG: hypothetical protein FWH23_05800 [Bacteroidales bacterium]|nr:hypothetical protein [Bacteroidales bacterium]
MISQRYFIKALKAIVLFFVIGTLIYVIGYFLGKSSRPDLTFAELIEQSNITSIVVFFVIFGLAYPLIGYVKQKVYASKPFEEYKQEVIRMFAQVKFELVSDNDNKMVFRNKSALSRLMRMYEDKVTVDYSDSPILLLGLRRDVYRLARMIQYYIRNAEKED